MLGAPLETLTILHHAEGIADVPDKRMVTFRVLVAEDGVVSEREYTDIDTSQGAVPYDRLDLGDTDEFEVIARAALDAGVGMRGQVAAAECHLFDAAELTAFGAAWIEERFGGR